MTTSTPLAQLDVRPDREPLCLRVSVTGLIALHLPTWLAVGWCIAVAVVLLGGSLPRPAPGGFRRA